ncbi:MAG: PEP/pyruvate-binding domain-containing protein [Bacteroidales bacterium]|nr:PEP/pyruvate-binding domain-containing protein [Bacteroidales bacterium]MDD4671357.1 PEP/pyruvate-binding domain-containing protein [Bacteroidales bacterium]MDY0348582.1 PEP/pyruvate-binding domain-containing protein [Tenuifilaceae bacterium]
MEKKLKSKALEANLQQTRDVEIVIPENHNWFISLSANKFGINQRVTEFIREFNHPYQNVDFLADNLKNIAISDFWLYASHPDAEKAFDVILDIIESLLLPCKTAKNADSLIHSLALFLEQVNAEETPFTATLDKGIDILEKAFSEQKDSVIQNANSLKKRLSPIVTDSSQGDRIFNLFIKIANETLNDWEKGSKIDEWAMSDLRFFPDENILIVKRVGKGFYTQLKQQVATVKSWGDFSEKVLLFTDIADYHRKIISEFDSPISQFHFIIYLLRMPTMEHHKEYLIWDLNKLLTQILNDVPNQEISQFVDDIFKLFEELLKKHKPIVLDCIATMGKEFARFFSKNLLSQFEDNVIRIGYTPPGKTHISADWQLKADPNHLKSIRVWLDLVEVAPERFEKLLSALIVNLKLGGVLLFDTDLFQRNVSNLLNADIDPVFKPVKELCKLLPVFYNEIGAEGELRDVTTEIDTLSNRQDKLMHFLRKQIHIDGNNTHLHLLEKIFGYWISGNFNQVASFLPPDIKEAIMNDEKWLAPMQTLIVKVSKNLSIQPKDILNTPIQNLNHAIDDVEGIEDLHKKKLRLFVQIAYLLRDKYFAGVTDIAQEMKASGCFDTQEVQQYVKAEHNNDYISMLKCIYQCMANLNAIVKNREKTEGWEDIYYKRHVAFGIPSMYGQYHEPKFEALGHIFRMEKVASTTMQKIVNSINLSNLTTNTLKQIAEVLSLFYKGLNLDGIINMGFESNLKMLRSSLKSRSFSLNQYINIFQFLSENVKEIIHSSFYNRFDSILKDVVHHYIDKECSPEEHQIQAHQLSEKFYREMLSGSFLLQDLDSFIAKVLNSLNSMAESYSEESLKNDMNLDVQMMITPLHKPEPLLDNKVFLGSKGYNLKTIYQQNFPVPPGFILTTELFRQRDNIMGDETLKTKYQEGIKENLHKIEQIERKQFGNSGNPLLISVRSGAPLSMPGAMNTFLNVGMNDTIAEALSKQPNMAWTTWDCYGRYLQSWGQAFGIERTAFESIVAKHQGELGEGIKEAFDPEQMREIAYEYKNLLTERDIPMYDDVYEQLFAAIDMVFKSWDGPRAQLYRKHLQIANEWGTAVIVQCMVFGNLHRSSGSGVVFTYDSTTQNPGIRLNGDYSLLSQGDDVVGGITHVLPVSEHQEKDTKGQKNKSLQKQLPRTYHMLFNLADKLVNQLHFGHQEIEFTFESDNPYDLHILQTRKQQIFKPETKTMYQTPPPKNKLLGRGIPIGASILNGQIIFDLDDLNTQKRQNPNGKFIYVSADTTPDDLHVVFECEGLVTSRGGATSHAAVTAGRLGKVCVVNCNDMIVYTNKKTCVFGKHELTTGDSISVDAHTGSIYAGHYELEDS